MAVYKDGDKWRVIYRYTNWNGERKQTQKRGFATKREAQAWEHEAMLKQDANLDMTFESFFEIYKADKIKRLKVNTWESKEHIVRTKIMPYFGWRKIAAIEVKDTSTPKDEPKEKETPKKTQDDVSTPKRMLNMVSMRAELQKKKEVVKERDEHRKPIIIKKKENNIGLE